MLQRRPLTRMIFTPFSNRLLLSHCPFFKGNFPWLSSSVPSMSRATSLIAIGFKAGFAKEELVGKRLAETNAESCQGPKLEHKNKEGQL